MPNIGEVTRITTKNMVIEFMPALFPGHRAPAYAAYDVPADHVTVLSLGGATSGTFKLAVNGRPTAAITCSASLASSVIQTALTDLMGVGTFTVTGDAGGPYTITAAGSLADTFIVIEIVAVTGLATAVTQAITTQGSGWIELQAEASSFSYSGTIESVDVTGLGESERTHVSTVSDATFEVSLYEALQSYRHALREGVEGYIRVFEDGKEAGKRYFAWQVLVLDANSDFPMHEKVEIQMSGRRQGRDIARVGSYWPG